MPTWALSLLTPIINWLLSWVERGFSALVHFLTFRWKMGEIVDKDQKQADKVEAIRAKIIELKKKGLPVPPELDQELIRESRKIDIGERFP